jgi:hypothetical protein
MSAIQINQELQEKRAEREAVRHYMDAEALDRGHTDNWYLWFRDWRKLGLRIIELDNQFWGE